MYRCQFIPNSQDAIPPESVTRTFSVWLAILANKVGFTSWCFGVVLDSWNEWALKVECMRVAAHFFLPAQMLVAVPMQTVCAGEGTLFTTAAKIIFLASIMARQENPSHLPRGTNRILPPPLRRRLHKTLFPVERNFWNLEKWKPGAQFLLIRVSSQDCPIIFNWTCQFHFFAFSNFR